jgi:hypothetical protein
VLLDHGQGVRSSPRRNSMNMTVNEYREFMEDVQSTAATLMKWNNDVILRGDRIVFPYAMD